MPFHAAVDLGASSGRVAVGKMDSNSIECQIVHRFEIRNFSDPQFGLVWDWNQIEKEVIHGLKLAKQEYPLVSVGVDAWGVDYRRYASDGRPLDPVSCYRNERLAGVMESVTRKIGRERIYSSTGIQFLPFNTIYQFAVAQVRGELDDVGTFQMLPDAINRFLCGSTSQEVTNASTTQLLNANTQDWDWALISELGIDSRIFPRLHKPGTNLGPIRGHGELDGIPVIAVGSHDTASAVAAVPFTGSQSAIFISSGTWSLIGYERESPNISAAALELNLTNEIGVQGSYRTLRNVAGMWLLSECQREWRSQGLEFSIDDLVAAAKEVDGNRFLINPNDDTFIAPGNMIERITSHARFQSDSIPISPGEIARCIFDSLASIYSELIARIEKLEGRDFDVIHIVGGGSANGFLNQLIADATQCPVVAGPVEATLLGNLAIQGIALNEISDIDEFRSVLSRNSQIQQFNPRSSST